MKQSFCFAIAVSALFVGCGGTTRIGTTSAHESGGASFDGGMREGSGGASTGGIGPSTGGRYAAGGRGSGGKVGSGGRAATGGRSFGGAGGADASFETGGASATGGADAGVDTSRPEFDSGSDPLRNRVPAGKVCDRFTTIQCAGERHCCSRTGRSYDVCKQAMMTTCQQFIDQMSVQAPLAYDIDRAQAAFDEFERRVSMCDTSVMPWAVSNAGFRAVARGTVSPGDLCVQADAGPPTVELVALVVSCATPETHACMLHASGDWFCDPRSDVGGTCYTDMNCKDGLFCELPQPNAKCTPRRPNGAPCSWYLQCESMTCGQNATCVPATLESAYCMPY